MYPTAIGQQQQATVLKPSLAKRDRPCVPSCAAKSAANFSDEVRIFLGMFSFSLKATATQRSHPAKETRGTERLLMRLLLLPEVALKDRYELHF